MPWDKASRDSYEKFSPQYRLAAIDKFQTPMLIIHNDLDCRVPVGEGHAAVPTSCSVAVASRRSMINFP